MRDRCRPTVLRSVTRTYWQTFTQTRVGEPPLANTSSFSHKTDERGWLHKVKWRMWCWALKAKNPFRYLNYQCPYPTVLYKYLVYLLPSCWRRCLPKPSSQLKSPPLGDYFFFSFNLTGKIFICRRIYWCENVHCCAFTHCHIWIFLLKNWQRNSVHS